MREDLVMPADTIQAAGSEPDVAILDRRLVLILAIACAISIGNLYYVQPMLADMGRSFAVSVDQIGFIATLGQLGYATGMLLIVPLGDSYNQRTLIVVTLVMVIFALVAMALAPTLALLALASFLVGLTAVVPQLIVPFAASLAPAKSRGQVVGTVMSGLLIGILLARTVSGFISAHLGWRAMYLIAAILMALLAVLMRFLLPSDPSPKSRMSYPQLLRSLWGLLRTEPVLRETSVFGAMVFGAFSAFWVILSFRLETPPYHLGSEVAGLFGLVGVVGALAASVIGKLTDRMEARTITGLAIVITLLSFVVMWLTGQWLWGLALGVILLDLGTQSNQISNQSRIYSLRPEVRNRLNTVYMTSYFLGGSLGSAVGTYGWSSGGWTGFCVGASLLVLIALGLYVLNNRRARA